MNLQTLRGGVPRDAGAALVAAIGVAIVGMAFSIIVLQQAIVATNDAARDRVRTVEVHAAEAALDSGFRTLETATPCETSMVSGTGATAVDVTTTYQYFNATGELLCTGGVVAGIPTKAVVTSVATPVNEMPGAVDPERRVQASLNLTPIMAPSVGVGIFAGGSMAIANSGSVTPLDPNERARIWVENADFNCSNSVVVDGDLIVTDGGINIANTCRVTGSAWSLKQVNASNNASPFRIGGDLVVYNGDLNASNTQKFGGNVSVGGNIYGTYTAVGTVCAKNVGSPCPPLPLYVKRGLPVVNYTPSDWPGFTVKTKAQFADDVVAGAGLTGSDATAFRAAPCAMTNKIKKPIVFTSTNTIYDLRTCDPLSTANQITFVINADTAFFVNGFAANNSTTIKSGDGLEHNVWFIVPTGGTGNISLSNTSTVIDPVHVFLFTPNSLAFANTQNMIGQAYATNVSGSNSLSFKYTGIGIPGVNLGDSVGGMAPIGYTVQIVSKHEIHN